MSDEEEKVETEGMDQVRSTSSPLPRGTHCYPATYNPPDTPQATFFSLLHIHVWEGNGMKGGGAWGGWGAVATTSQPSSLKLASEGSVASDAENLAKPVPPDTEWH
eukprot:1155915-Pelagomonas_calceolata.AAC.6